MINNLTYKEIIDFLKKDSIPGFLEDIDTFFTLALFISAATISPPAAGLVATANTLSDLLGVKDGIMQLSRRIFNRVAQKREESPLEHLYRMQVAYHLICYTSFFDAVESLFPEITAKANLCLKDKVWIAGDAAKAALADSEQPVLMQGILSREYANRVSAIPFPHPLDSFEELKSKITNLHSELGKGFLMLLTHMVVWDTLNDTQKEDIKKGLTSLPKVSGDYFEAQYYNLAINFEEFYIWANLQQHKGTQIQINQLTKYTQLLVNLAQRSKENADLGFGRLAEAIAELPSLMVENQASAAIQELENHYEYLIERPIIKDSTIAKDDVPLVYPKTREIFIPQAFKALRYHHGSKLEHESTWKDVPTRDDLGAFLLNYFSSPYSHSAPLVILGHPGSGKSLLTSILSARLISPMYTPIRVELRGSDTDNRITAQVVEQVKKDTGREVSWAMLCDQFKEKPGLILLDGYDELLQASGKVFGDYLQDVQRFQEQEISVKRMPVRVVVTSRITLIDKAAIPEGTTIIRLLEFDEAKRSQWISIWNTKNETYFRQTGVDAFEIPMDDRKVLALAEQPLLLLMLALYDSDKNQLKGKKGLEQTLLYDSLLRQFVERELQKDKQFMGFAADIQQKQIDREIERLGVAATGMFNRRSLYITHSQLGSDLKFFELERPATTAKEKTLSQADRMVGSFFFVRDPKSIGEQADEPENRIDYPIEFLHNSFGEFLTADFILRAVVGAADTVYENGKLEKRNNSHLRQMLLGVDGQRPAWYVTLMYAPLFSRPTIVEMLREWAKHHLEAAGLEKADFLTSLDKIINSQIEHLLSSNQVPAVMLRDESLPFGKFPLFGYLAIYTLNLIVLRTVVSQDGYTFDEEIYQNYQDGSRVWERLTHLWRAWFSLENLERLAAILEAKREGTKIQLRAHKVFSSAPTSNNRVNTVYNASRALADHTSLGLAGLLLAEQSISARGAGDDFLSRNLTEDDLDVKLEVLIRRWRHIEIQGERDNKTYDVLLAETLQALKQVPDQSSVLNPKGTSGPLSAAVLIHECLRITQIVRGNLSAMSLANQIGSNYIHEKSFPNKCIYLNDTGIIGSFLHSYDQMPLSSLIYQKSLWHFIENNFKFQLEKELFGLLTKGGFDTIQQQQLVTQLLDEWRNQDNLTGLRAVYLGYLLKEYKTFASPSKNFSYRLTLETIRIARTLQDEKNVYALYKRLRNAVFPSLSRYLLFYRLAPSMKAEIFRAESTLPEPALPIELVVELMALTGTFQDEPLYTQIKGLLTSESVDLFTLPIEFLKTYIQLVQNMDDIDAKKNIYQGFYKLIKLAGDDKAFFRDLDFLIQLAEIDLDLTGKADLSLMKFIEGQKSAPELLLDVVDESRLMQCTLMQVARITRISERMGRDSQIKLPREHNSLSKQNRWPRDASSNRKDDLAEDET